MAKYKVKQYRWRVFFAKAENIQHREVDFRDKMKLVIINDCTDFHTEGNDAVTSTFSRKNH